MGVRVTYYLADFFTGDFLGRALPLDVQQLSSSLKPGSFRATLDMRRACDSFADAAALRDMLRSGKTTLVPVMEDIRLGGDVIGARELGEWWVQRVDGDAASPVINLSGPEWDGYAQQMHLTRDRKSKDVDPVALGRQLLWEMWNTGQTTQWDPQEWISHAGVRTDIDLAAHTRTFAEVMRDISAGVFEWRTTTSVELVGRTATRVLRRLEVGQPVLRLERPDMMLEFATPGTGNGSLLSVSFAEDQDLDATSVTAFGGGSGKDQRRATRSRARVAGEPIKTRMLTDSDAIPQKAVDRVAERALGTFTPQERVFTATMPADRFTVTTGERYPWIRNPSWSMPTRETGHVRCVGWDRVQEKPGTRPVFALQLVRD